MLLKVDIVLALLQENTPESIQAAEDLAGIRITRCPPAVPPWPPHPVRRSDGEPRVKSVRKVQVKTLRVRQQFAEVKVGRTVREIVSRGVDKRHIRKWVADGTVELDRRTV